MDLSSGALEKDQEQVEAKRKSRPSGRAKTDDKRPLDFKRKKLNDS